MSTLPATNAIGARLNAPTMIDLLRARARIYARVKRVQRYYFLFIFVLPLVSLLVAFHRPEWKPWVSLVALIVGALDAMVLDPWRKGRIKTAARIQEEFDCDVLQMPWNQFTAGKRVPAEEISRDARRRFKADQEERLLDWYPANAIDLPMHVARLVCQRTNLWYDAQLRTTYRTALCTVAVLYFVGLLLFAWQDTIAAFVLVIFVPFGPFFTWVVREYQRQRDTGALVDRLLSEIDRSLERLTDSEGAPARSRELQDAIFAHRASSPLISDLVYRCKRTGLESEMQAGAAAFIEKAKRAMVEAV